MLYLSNRAQALNRFAIGALVAVVTNSWDLFCGLCGWEFAVGRGDFASVNRAFPHDIQHSFGIQKITGFARALAAEPKLLLLDEPSAGLNRDDREDLARFILRIKHELGIPMIWIEHDMQMVGDLADRLQVLDYGKTIATGAPEEVLSNQQVINDYLGVEG